MNTDKLINHIKWNNVYYQDFSWNDESIYFNNSGEFPSEIISDFMKNCKDIEFIKEFFYKLNLMFFVRDIYPLSDEILEYILNNVYKIKVACFTSYEVISYICSQQTLSESFIEKNQSHFNFMNFQSIIQSQILSLKFIEKLKNKFKPAREYVRYNNRISQTMKNKIYKLLK